MFDKKQIWAIFLFEFKMGCKVVETTCNINNAFGPGTANECTVQCVQEVLHPGTREEYPHHHPLLSFVAANDNTLMTYSTIRKLFLCN